MAAGWFNVPPGYDPYAFGVAPGAQNPPALPPPQNFGPGVPDPRRSIGGMPPINAVPPMPQPGFQGYDPLSSIQAPGPLPVQTIEQTSTDEQGLDAPQDTGKQTDKYSFFDSPGASDSLIAFGASMLKAPDFLTGLADGAMAVNQVAQKYRPFSQQEMDKARQLAQMKLLSDPEYYRQQQEDPNALSVDQKNAYYDENGKMYFPATQGTQNGWIDTTTNEFIAGGVPGLVRATDSPVGPEARGNARANSEINQSAAEGAQASQSLVSAYDEMMGEIDSAGVGSDLLTKAQRLANIAAGANIVGDSDITSIGTWDAAPKRIQLDWSQKLKGQGQVTEFERRIIAEALPQAGMNKDAAKRLLNTLKKGAQRKVDLYRMWSSNPSLKREWGNNYIAWELNELQKISDEQEKSNQGSGTSNSSTTGKKSLSDIFGN
jgi:hypothetical protein